MSRVRLNEEASARQAVERKRVEEKQEKKDKIIMIINNKEQRSQTN